MRHHGPSLPVLVFALEQRDVRKVIVEVNEEGTEAAAATGVVNKTESAKLHRDPVFRADHPFFFVIRDNRNGSVLFAGRLAQPEKERPSTEGTAAARGSPLRRSAAPRFVFFTSVFPAWPKWAFPR